MAEKTGRFMCWVDVEVGLWVQRSNTTLNVIQSCYTRDIPPLSPEERRQAALVYWFILVCLCFWVDIWYFSYPDISLSRVKNGLNLYPVTFQMTPDPGMSMSRHLNKFCGQERLITSSPPSAFQPEQQQPSQQRMSGQEKVASSSGKLMKMVRSESDCLMTPESRTGSSVKISQSSNPNPPPTNRRKRWLCEGKEKSK